MRACCGPFGNGLESRGSLGGEEGKKVSEQLAAGQRGGSHAPVRKRPGCGRPR